MLGARIAALRRNSGLSQASLAKALGISASAVGMYEQGRREPSADGIVRIAALFHVSTDYLLTGTPRTQEDLVFLRSFLQSCRQDPDALVCRRPDGSVAPVSQQDLATIFSVFLGQNLR